MKWILYVAGAILAAPGVVVGECPNQCSGHGRCSNYKMVLSASGSTTVPSIKVPTSPATVSAYGYDTAIPKKDSCTCFTRQEDGSTVYAYKGPDCSRRTCPYGRSWNAPPADDQTHDYMAECSDKGICDEATGECRCFPGYTGKGCRRSVCPNSCSGHGRCKTLKEIATTRQENTAWDTIPEFSNSAIQYANAWDAEKLMGCECDSGYKGADCSLVECPSTADVMGGPGSESGRECSGRGKCDYSTGTCKCYQQYGGDKCEILKQAYL